MRLGDAKRHRPHDANSGQPKLYKSAGLRPARFPRRAAYIDPREAASFRAAPIRKDPRLRLRGSIPFRQLHLSGGSPGTWLCGPAKP